MDADVSTDGLTRRAVLESGAAWAAVAALLGSSARAEQAAKDDPPGDLVRSLEKVEPQKFAWGWIRWMMNGEVDSRAEMTLGIVHIEPNQSSPPHIHPNSAEYLYVLEGSCEHRLGGRWMAMKAGDMLRIPKDVPHCARTKTQPCLALIVYDTPKRQMVSLGEK